MGRIFSPVGIFTPFLTFPRRGGRDFYVGGFPVSRGKGLLCWRLPHIEGKGTFVLEASSYIKGKGLLGLWPLEGVAVVDCVEEVGGEGFVVVEGLGQCFVSG